MVWLHPFPYFSQVSDLEAQVHSLKEQLSSRAELTNEMKALLVQRAARIRSVSNPQEYEGHPSIAPFVPLSLAHRQLERTVQRQRQDLSQVNSEHNISGVLSTSLSSNWVRGTGGA